VVADERCPLPVPGSLGALGGSWSSRAVNPALTAMANAIRVGEHLLSRMA
jgi:hypothetical protein